MSTEIAQYETNIALYVRLVWLFVAIITVLMLCLCYLYLSMRRAEERESQSFAFSHLMIEGLETERRRVSRELHDTILPLVRGEPVAGLIRSICMELMPPDFVRLALKDSLADLCAQFTARTNIECAYSIEDNLDFSMIVPENQLHLYRMAQEAFTNIEKHSGARNAALVVRRSGGSLLICISDDGVGLGAKTGLSAAGLGMRSMRQRAAILGAKLDFKSESGNGLMVRIELPSLAAGKTELSIG